MKDDILTDIRNALYAGNKSLYNRDRELADKVIELHNKGIDYDWCLNFVISISKIIKSEYGQ